MTAYLRRYLESPLVTCQYDDNKKIITKTNFKVELDTMYTQGFTREQLRFNLKALEHMYEFPSIWLMIIYGVFDAFFFTRDHKCCRMNLTGAVLESFQVDGSASVDLTYDEESFPCGFVRTYPNKFFWEPLGKVYYVPSTNQIFDGMLYHDINFSPQPLKITMNEALAEFQNPKHSAHKMCLQSGRGVEWRS